MVEVRNAYRIVNWKGRDHLGDPGIDGRNI
jgi:hypothetical protein